MLISEINKSYIDWSKYPLVYQVVVNCYDSFSKDFVAIEEMPKITHGLVAFYVIM